MDQITKFDLYMLLKLDDIRYIMKGLSLALIAVAAACAFIAVVGAEELSEKTIRRMVHTAIVTGILFLAMICTRALLPSTKQAAVIYAGPAIANSKFVREDLSNEGRELYDLAKEWLKAAVEEKKKGNQ